MNAPGMLIVGAGEAGVRAALALRENRYGGPVTLIGDEPHRPYERPPLSKAAMTAEAEPLAPYIVDEARLAEHQIAHLFGLPVTAIDRGARRVVRAAGSEIAYDKLLIATGARPRTLDLPGAGPGNVLYLRSFADALAMRRRLVRGSALVVIGGGFIGLEIAASAIVRGCSVTLVEMAPRLLMRGVPAEIAAVVQARHERAGVVFRIGTGLDRIEREGEAEAVVLADGTRLRCDTVIAGIGAIPNTALAAESGLGVDNGVAVDATLRTSDPAIFAVGDCCSFPHPLYGGRRLRLEAWRNAQDQGNHVARTMLGADAAYRAVPWFWSDQYDQELQIAGLPDEGRTIVRRDLGSDGMLLFHLAADGRLVAASAVGPNRIIGKEVRLAEMLIARAARPDPDALASAATRLKTLLAA